MSAPTDYHPSLDDPNAWVPYRYNPSLAAAVIFLIAFTIATGWHAVTLFRRRTWYYTPFLIAGIFEIVGYCGRIASTKDLWALSPYIIQSILLLVAPALFAASIYIVLGRIIRFTGGERYSLVPVKWLTRAFVAGDVVAFLAQMTGGGIQAGGTISSLNLGEKIIIVGLFLQVIFFGIFITVATVWHLRFNRQTAVQLNAKRDVLWRKYMWSLYGGSALIMIRSIFRIIEYLMGNDGFLLRHEYLLYIFDALLMFLVMVLFLWLHPSKLTMFETSDVQPGHDMEEGGQVAARTAGHRPISQSTSSERKTLLGRFMPSKR
ncbi:hypothetical protein LTR78_009698 [Recurvomyces mirabilis]|uniref:Uncharacterized protein n=1 Tax=Recurvomyces mirabilis TaxID=574656 RepID=A0AAE0TNG8_9PEZI|nr:hypothetical protein LTR78_009698 [Recurvomyces mirabilis]KAK5150260.1 hypothetical protein LTS14_010236 [Recurvomyces mirabilis]